MGKCTVRYHPEYILIPNYLPQPDRNLIYETGIFVNTVSASASTMQHFTLPNIQISKPGYIYIYLSNESTSSTKIAIFDELNVTLTRPIIQSEEYYPFGLTVAENSYTNLMETDNKCLYNGKELQDDLNLNWYDYGARMYDAALGRWHVPDILGELREFESPYCYVGNNPILRFDPDGRKWKTKEDEKQSVKDSQQTLKENRKLEKKVDKLNQKIQKASEKNNNKKVESLLTKINEARDKININVNTVTNLAAVKHDLNRTFRFGNSTFIAIGQPGAQMTRDADGTYVVNNLGTFGSRIHEENHAAQVVSGKIDFYPGRDSPYKNVGGMSNEVESYKAEYSVGSNSLGVDNLGQITEDKIISTFPGVYK